MNAPLSAEVGTPTKGSALFPGGCLTGTFELRNPFRARSLTWQCRQHLKLHHEHPGSGRRAQIRHWFRHQIYRASRSRTNLPPGEASLLVEGAWRDFSFNAANTQFESIYAPDCRNGYEPETTVLIDALLPDDGVLFDIGANWGHISLFAASKPDFRGQIHAFEPMPPTHADLVASVKGTGLEKMVVTHDVALSDHDGSSRMIVPDGEQSGLAMFWDKEDGSPVKVATLDGLGLPMPGLIKIDVERYEAAVLRGARQTLRQGRPLIIFESALGHDVKLTMEPFHLLQEEGYVFFLPAFVREENGVTTYTPYGFNSDLSGTVRLALVPFAPEGRHLLPPHANIFACPAGRVTEVAARFGHAAVA